jgi:3-hydroxybutyryl-CoA dehydrogenase
VLAVRSGLQPHVVWAVPELKELLVELGATPEFKPTPEAVCFVAPLGADATTSALELGLDPERTVAVDPLFGFTKRRTLMRTCVTRKEILEAAQGLLATDGVPVSVINDSPSAWSRIS